MTLSWPRSIYQYSDMAPRLSGQKWIFLRSFCLSIPKWDLNTKKTPLNIEVCPERLRSMLAYWYIERGLLVFVLNGCSLALIARATSSCYWSLVLGTSLKFGARGKIWRHKARWSRQWTSPQQQNVCLNLWKKTLVYRMVVNSSKLSVHIERIWKSRKLRSYPQ